MNAIPADINTTDTQDVGLKQIFGARFQDFTSGEPVKPIQKPASKPMGEDKPVNDQFVPIESDQPRWLWPCAKAVGLDAGIGILVFAWQQMGLMAEAVAYPTTVFMAIMAGISIGKFVRK